MTKKAWIIAGVASIAVTLIVSGAALVRAVPRFTAYDFLRGVKADEEQEIVYDLAGKKTAYSQRNYRLKGDFWSIADKVEKELLAKGWRTGFHPPRGGGFKFRMFTKASPHTAPSIFPMENSVILSAVPNMRIMRAGGTPLNAGSDNEVSVSITEGPIESSWLRDLSARLFPSKTKKSTVTIGRSGPTIVYSVGTGPVMVRSVVRAGAAPAAPRKP